MDASTTPAQFTNSTTDQPLESPATWSVAVIVVSFFGVALVALGLYIRNRRWGAPDMQEILIELAEGEEKTNTSVVKVAWGDEMAEPRLEQGVQQNADNITKT